MKLKITYSPWTRSSVARKFISSSLTIGLLFNSTLPSFASTLSEDGRYETFEGNNITVDNVLEEEKVDVEIEGSTVVNLCGDVISTGAEISVDNNMIIFNNPNEGNISFKLNNIQSSTTYTAIIRSKEISYPIHVDLFPDTFQEITTVNNSKSLYKVVFTTPEDISDLISFRYYVSTTRSGISSLEKPIIIKGDWADKEIPEYFEGVKSVGQYDENSHKIEILSTVGKPNLFKNSGFLSNTSHIISNAYSTLTVINDNSSYSGKILKIVAGDHSSSSGFYQANLIPYVDNTKYTLSCYCKGEVNSILEIAFEHHKSTRIQFTDDNWVKVELTSNLNPTNWNRTVTFYSKTPFATFHVKDIKVEVSDCATPYIPHTTEINYNTFERLNKKEILLNEPLRGLDNGVKDRIIKRNGQWVVERNCREIILDGTENWSTGTESNGWTVYDDSLVVYTDSYAPKANARYMCDKLPYIGGSGVCTQNTVGTSNQTWSSAGHISIRIPYSYLETENLNGFKQWLSENNLKIIYQLETPIYEPLNIDSTLSIYLETTYIFNNSNIPANIKVAIDRTMNKAVEAVELAKLDPTTENLSDARYWANLLRESVKKDELQSVITNIIGPTDIELERKTVSANTDVYVKSENMLSMSLSTNSVSFDNYSGVEDMEILDAVNITINSSLPYSLNAYMPNGITSNNSNQMDKDILNIRDNSEGDYQSFDDSTNKLVLKDGCAEGNNKQHSIDLKLASGNAHKADVYKTVIKFEVEQK